MSLSHTSSISDPLYNGANTRVVFTDGTHRDFDWEGVVTEQTTIDDGLLDGSTHEWNKDISEVHFGNAVTMISDYAFSWSDTIESVTFEENSIATVVNGAFAKCPNLATTDGFSILTDRVVTTNPETLGSNVVVPTAQYQISYINPWAFVNDISGKIVTLTIPNTIDLANDALIECRYLTDLYLPTRDIDSLLEQEFNNYSGWGLGVTFDESDGHPIYHHVTIHCSDGTIENGYDQANETYYYLGEKVDDDLKDVITRTNN